DRLSQRLVPRDIAPHTDELRTAEVAGGNSGPLSCRGGAASPQGAKVFDPIPGQHWPILVVNDGPTLGRHERLLGTPSGIGQARDLVGQEALPIRGLFGIQGGGGELEVVVS